VASAHGAGSTSDGGAVQIIEVTEFCGVRSAVFTFRHRTSSLRFVVFPMVHLGDATFYAEVESRLRAVDVVIAEGVHGRSPYAAAITSVYRWLEGCDRLDLVVQRIDYPGLGVPVICPDMSAAEFDRAWRQVPLRTSVPFIALSPVVGLGLRLFATRRFIASFLGTDDLPSAEEVLAGDGYAAVDAVLVEARDRRLVEYLQATHDQLGDLPATIAVLYGAHHVRAIVRALSRLGYRAADSEWLTVFEMEVPDR
jgi:hypothetical protein